MNRKLVISLFVIALLALGFFREMFFININSVLYNKYFQPTDEAHIYHPAFSFLTYFSYKTLYISKWFITLAFVALFWLIQKKFIFYLFDEKKAVFWLGMLYLSLLLLAGISFGAGWLFGNLEQGYRFSRIFMGLLQSPVPCMMLIPLTYFYKKQTQL